MCGGVDDKIICRPEASNVEFMRSCRGCRHQGPSMTGLEMDISCFILLIHSRWGKQNKGSCIGRDQIDGAKFVSKNNINKSRGTDRQECT